MFVNIISSRFFLKFTKRILYISIIDCSS